MAAPSLLPQVASSNTIGFSCQPSCAERAAADGLRQQHTEYPGLEQRLQHLWRQPSYASGVRHGVRPPRTWEVLCPALTLVGVVAAEGFVLLDRSDLSFPWRGECLRFSPAREGDQPV